MHSMLMEVPGTLCCSPATVVQHPMSCRSRASADADLTDHLHDLHALDMWAPPAEADVARPSWSGWRAAFNASEESSRTRCAAF